MCDDRGEDIYRIYSRLSRPQAWAGQKTIENFDWKNKQMGNE
jgi:hypothetical protein